MVFGLVQLVPIVVQIMQMMATVMFVLPMLANVWGEHNIFVLVLQQVISGQVPVVVMVVTMVTATLVVQIVDDVLVRTEKLARLLRVVINGVQALVVKDVVVVTVIFV